jgi:hypothetical protein
LLKVTGMEEVVSPASAIAPNTIPRIQVRIMISRFYVFPFPCQFYEQAARYPLVKMIARTRERLSIGIGSWQQLLPERYYPSTFWSVGMH